MICIFALRICQYDKNILSSMIASVVLFFCIRKHLYIGLFEIVIVFV